MRSLLVASGHSHSTRDVFTGYRAALRELGHEVHDANLHNWYSYHDVALRAWRKKTGNDIPPGYLSQLATEQIGVEIVKFRPDVVLAVCGLALHIVAFDMCWQLGVPMTLLLTESPYLDQVQAKRVVHPAVKLAFVNDRVSVLGLRQAMTSIADYKRATAESPEAKTLASEMKSATVVYLPHSFDPARHYPADDLEKRLDCYFYGTMWPERRAVLAPTRRWLRWRYPFRHSIIGGVGSVAKWAPKGLTDNSVLAENYRQCKIALNHHRTIVGGENGQEQHIEDAHSLGPRAYEIAACCAFQLCDDARPELGEEFGSSVATYSDADDLRAQVAYYLAHEQEREEMAWIAYQRVQGCTFEARAREIVIPALEGVV